MSARAILIAGLVCALFCARARGADADLPRISVVSGRIEVRQPPRAPELFRYSSGASGMLAGPGAPGGRTLIEANVLGEDLEWGTFKPRLRIGYGGGSSGNPASSYGDIYVRAVLIREF